MKSFITIIATLATVTAFAQSEPVLMDVPADDQVVQSVSMKGRPDRVVTASLVKSQDENFATLMITHQKPNDVRHFVGAMNDTEFGVNESLAGFTTLEKNAGGSLLIKSANESFGRDRYSRTLTVAYRDNQYKIIGFTFYHLDTFNMKSDNCDYNLQTGKGNRNGKAVKISTKSISLEKFEENEKSYSCKGW